MPKLAKTLDVKRRGRTVTLTIDGEEFAWYLADEPITHTMESKAVSTVNLTLVAEHVTIDDDLDPGVPVGQVTSAIDCRQHQARQHRDGKAPWCNECGLTENGQEPASRFAEHVTIDGELVTIPFGDHDVKEVLAAAGVHAQTHDLLRVDADGHTITHRTGNTVKLGRGDRFVTARISATT